MNPVRSAVMLVLMLPIGRPDQVKEHNDKMNKLLQVVKKMSISAN